MKQYNGAQRHYNGAISRHKFIQPHENIIDNSADAPREIVKYGPNAHSRVWYNNQNEAYPLHYHDTFEIIYCIESQYTVIVNNKSIKMQSGDILFIPPNTFHEVGASESGLRIFYQFDVSSFKDFHDYSLLSPVFEGGYLCNSKRNKDIYHSILEKLLYIVDIYFSNCKLWEAIIFSQLLNIFIQIYNDFKEIDVEEAEDEISEESSEYIERLTSFLNYIDVHYAEEITLDDAAKSVGFSKYHFTRIFKQHTGYTFHEYLNYKRIQIAQALLATDMSITDIAFQTGFNNLTTFCRCFKKYVNASPTEYRKYFDPNFHKTPQ